MKHALIIALACFVTFYITSRQNIQLSPASYETKPLLSEFIACVSFQSSIPAIGDADIDGVIQICSPAHEPL